jgi:hypothetical protein
VFCGDYRTVGINDTWFLNPIMADSNIAKFETLTRGYKNYFEKHLGIPYKGIATYIHTTPVSKYNGWMFNSYPAIVDIGFDKEDHDWSSPYFSHELAHFYFGTTRNFNSALGDAITEGFAEYLSLHVARRFSGDSLFQAKIASKLRALRNFKAVPFASIYSRKDYGDRELYSYYYAPLIFTAIEKQVGEEAMLNDKNKLAQVRSRYFNGDSVIQFLAAELGVDKNNNAVTATTAQESKTYYYFFFTKPMIDRGAEENKTIVHSEIGELTCLPSELSAKAAPMFKKIQAACENEAGCSSDFNTYNTLETAQAALQRWLKPYIGNPNFVIKKINF